MECKTIIAKNIYNIRGKAMTFDRRNKFLFRLHFLQNTRDTKKFDMMKNTVYILNCIKKKMKIYFDNV